MQARLARTFAKEALSGSSSTTCGSQKQTGASSAATTGKRKLAAAAVVTAAIAATIKHISKTRRLERAVIVDGDKLSRTEFARARTDYLELRRVYAMNIYLKLRREGMSSQEAYAQAAQSVVTSSGGKQSNWQTLRRWLRAFINAGGKLHLSQRGRYPSTTSLLSDPGMKEQAVKWLRDQLRLMRAKNTDTQPLTIDSFHKWINSTLLKPTLDADARLKPVGRQTAREWLHKLGFEFKPHTKSIYYDGHERADVVQTRMELIAMLKALEEVTVTFTGKNCDTVRWPLLHPDERPVVLVSQDESAYHSNDDIKSEWAEAGKGFTIKQKSRGSLLMVSMFISELHGILRCNQSQLDTYIREHPQSHLAAKVAANPSWSRSSTLVLEPGAAPGKDKYFDAEQLIEQTKIAREIFEATHVMPGRWAYHPSHRGPTSNATYPYSFEAVWLPPARCMPLFFFDHSSGHGAYASDALVAQRANKLPDFKGSVPVMRNGYFRRGPTAAKQRQVMQFSPGDILLRDITIPSGVDPTAAATATRDTAAAVNTGDAAAAAAASLPPPPQIPPPPSTLEMPLPPPPHHHCHQPMPKRRRHSSSSSKAATQQSKRKIRAGPLTSGVL